MNFSVSDKNCIKFEAKYLFHKSASKNICSQIEEKCGKVDVLQAWVEGTSAKATLRKILYRNNSFKLVILILVNELIPTWYIDKDNEIYHCLNIIWVSVNSRALQ